MASETDVANLALTMMGSDRINALSDANEKARLINGVFATLRDAELRKHTWSFSVKRTSLAALSSTPTYGYAREFQLPTDCLRLLSVGGASSVSMTDYRAGEEPPYAIEGQVLRTDLTAPLYIRYVRRVTDAGEFDASFVVALAGRIALACCEKLTQSSTKKADIRAEYRAALLDAMKANAIERPPRAVDDATWIMARI